MFTPVLTLGLPQLPNALAYPSPLPSSVSADIPGAVPERLRWHLPHILFTHSEYDSLWLGSRVPRSGVGVGVSEGESGEGTVDTDQIAVRVS